MVYLIAAQILEWRCAQNVVFTLHVDELITYHMNERDTCAVHARCEGGASVDGRGRARFRTSSDA